MRETNNSFNVQFYVRESKVRKNGYAPLEVGINLNGARKFLSLPYKCLPADFNRKKQPKELVEYQASMRKRINEIITEILSSGMPLTAEGIMDYLKNGGYKSYTVKNLFDQYIAILENRVGKTLTKSVFSKYLLVRDLFYTVVDREAECSTITPAHVQQFKSICENRYETSTTGGYLQKLKTVLTFGIDNGKMRINPFQGVKITKGSKDIEYLTEGELAFLESLEIENESLRNVRDCFLFECYSGISYADLCRITADDIKEYEGTYYIQGKRQKTGKEYTAVLLPNFINLIDFKYNFRQNLQSIDFQRVEKKFRFKMIANQKENAYLHVIEKAYNFPKKLTTHLARHTYATLLANKYKCRMEVVASALGDSLKVTTKHYAKFLSDTTISEIGNSIRSAV